MRRGFQETANAWPGLILSIGLGIFALVLLQNADVPMWQPLISGGLGILGFALFGRQVWAKSQTGRKAN